MSDGCTHCYAEALSLRRGWSAKPWTKPNAAENVILHPERLDLPLRWKEPRRVFVDSMSDLFHEEIPDSFIAQVFGVMALAPEHIFQVLTKRPERMLTWLSATSQATAIDELVADPSFKTERWQKRFDQRQETILAPSPTRPLPWPLPNVWLGVSVEDQRRADERIPLLLQTPAAVRFLSCEPLLSDVNLNQWLDVQLQTWHDQPERGSIDGWRVKANPATGLAEWRPALDWVIVGGESGPGYRPMDLDWARSLRDQCLAADVAYFFKQSSGARPGSGVELDGRLWHEFPQQSTTEETT